MSSAGTPTPLRFELRCEKRAVRRVDKKWVVDEDSFARRWKDGQRPDIGSISGPDYGAIAEQASRYNEAQLRSGYIDWWFSADVAAPVHECTPACTTNPKSRPKPEGDPK